MAKADDKENSNIEVYLQKVRLSHPHLWKATTFKGDKNAKPKFQASFIIDPKENKREHDAIWGAIEEVQIAKWDDAEYVTGEKLPYADGDRKNKKKPRPEYVGKWILTAKNDRRPQVVDRDKTPLTAEDPIPYAGCFVDALVRVYALDNEWGQRVNCSLEIIRFHKDGEAFGPEAADLDDMPDLPEDGEKSGRSMGRGRGRDAEPEREDRGSRRGGEDRGRGSSERGRGDREPDRGSRRGSADEDRPTERGRGRGDDAPRRGGREDAPRERAGRRSVSADDVV
jgi:hypothetical protein